MKRYTIFKNWHFAFCFFRRFIGGWYYDESLFTFTFKFSNECWWNTPRNHDDYDLNKLMGISFGLRLHKNSVRLAWRPNFDKPNTISVFGYMYDESKDTHTSMYLCDVSTNQECLCYLNLYDSAYVFNVPGISKIEMINPTQDKKIQKRLHPYFGGNNKAPQTMKIWVKLKPS